MRERKSVLLLGMLVLALAPAPVLPLRAEDLPRATPVTGAWTASPHSTIAVQSGGLKFVGRLGEASLPKNMLQRTTDRLTFMGRARAPAATTAAIADPVRAQHLVTVRAEQLRFVGRRVALTGSGSPDRDPAAAHSPGTSPARTGLGARQLGRGLERGLERDLGQSAPPVSSTALPTHDIVDPDKLMPPAETETDPPADDPPAPPPEPAPVADEPAPESTPPSEPDFNPAYYSGGGSSPDASPDEDSPPTESGGDTMAAPQ